MRIVTQTEALSERFGDQRAVEIICQSGFSGIDYSMFFLNNEKCALAEEDWRDYLKPVKATADRYSVPFTQSHCPFPTAKKDDSAYNKFMLERTKRAFEASAYLGVEIMVVHPVTYDPEGTDFEVNYKLYQQLKPFAEETGVKIALENMWRGRERKITDIFNKDETNFVPGACGTGKDFRQLLDMLDSPLFVACLDIGHCGMVGEDPAEMIRTIGGKHLKALHVHDNDTLRDAHIFPFNGTV
ncbi:MAG: sugar phosphate isomerase/epimerase, partial [Clostridia bacterium]|nr:sugar phosphate isomerase/epimerase [Clostridia bacterium]